jgi:hypothetical protein
MVIPVNTSARLAPAIGIAGFGSCAVKVKVYPFASPIAVPV